MIGLDTRLIRISHKTTVQSPRARSDRAAAHEEELFIIVVAMAEMMGFERAYGLPIETLPRDRAILQASSFVERGRKCSRDDGS